MKACISFLALWVASLFASCTHSPYPAKLVAADSIAEYAPLRAQAILDSLRPSIRQKDKATYNYYRLMCVKAADKALKPLPHDDTIAELMRYYEEQEDEDLLPVAYYYMGRSYMVQYNYPQALRYFQKSLEIIDKSDRVSTLKGQLYNQPGRIFQFQMLYDGAIKKFFASYEHNKCYENYRAQMFDLRNIASCYRSKKDYKKAEHYYLKALELASEHKEEDLVADISCLLSDLYLRTGDLDKALKYVKLAVEYNDPDDQVAILSISADIYNAAGKTDSAYARYNKMMSIDDVHAKKFAFKRLAEYYLMKNDAARSLSCTKGYEQMLDSISVQSATEELTRMDAVFHNQQKEQQINQLKTDKSNYQKLITLICSVAVFFVLVCLVAFLYLRAKHLSIRVKMEHRRQLDKDEFELTDVFVQQNKEKTEYLEHDITSNGIDGDNVLTLKELQRKLRIINEVSIQRKAQLEIIKDVFQNTDEYKMLMKKLQDKTVTNKKLSSDEWRGLEEAIGRRVDNFKQCIETVCKLSDQEYKVCILLKMGIPPSSIADITNKTRGAISLTRQRLYERAFGQKKSPDAWDRFIFSL